MRWAIRHCFLAALAVANVHAVLRQAVPSRYDPREVRRCRGFVPFDQGTCNACCAAAAAASASIRTCLNDLRDVTYSVQHLWDCANTAPRCNSSGVVVRTYFEDSLYLNSVGTRGMLVPADGWGNQTALTNAVFSRCDAAPASGAEDMTGLRLSMSWGSLQEAASALKEELYFRGPVVVTLAFYADEWNALGRWAGGGVFPTLHSNRCYAEAGCVHHCLTVLGWGTAESGDAYWLMQNSFGAAWGEAGFIKMKAADWEIERNNEWYAITSKHLNCDASISPLPAGCAEYASPPLADVMLVDASYVEDASRNARLRRKTAPQAEEEQAIPNVAIAVSSIACILAVGGAILCAMSGSASQWLHTLAAHLF